MTKRDIVLIDLDGVLADFDGATHIFLEKHHPEIQIAEHKNYYYRYDYPDPAHVAIIDALHTSQYFFRDLPLIEGAIEGWQRVIELGYEPRICSSPLHSNEWCKDEKLYWIEQHLGKQASQTAIITVNKEQAEGFVLIDDRPEIKDADKASWKHVVFGQPYNQHIDTPLRLNGWNDKNLPTILEQAAKMSSLGLTSR